MEEQQLRTAEPRISVIVPTLQEQDYIATILSQLSKTDPPVEVIVVDGGSQDKTVETARQFTEQVYRTSKRGIAAGRNYGAKKASGEILIFMDTDITIPANFQEKVLRTFKDSTVVGATCNIMPLDNETRTTAFFRLYNLIIRTTSRFRPHSRGEFLAVRRKAFQQIEGFNETMPCLEDHDFAYRLSKLGRFAFISDLTVYESLRRFKKLGFGRVVGTWMTDYIFFSLRGKPLSQEWKPAR